MDPRPEDRKDGEIADGAGELGFFPPYSWWPLWCAMALGTMVFGTAMGAWWLLIIGGRDRRDRALRLDLRVLPRRARALILRPPARRVVYPRSDLAPRLLGRSLAHGCSRPHASTAVRTPRRRSPAPECCCCAALAACQSSDLERPRTPPRHPAEGTPRRRPREGRPGAVRARRTECAGRADRAAGRADRRGRRADQGRRHGRRRHRRSRATVDGRHLAVHGPPRARHRLRRPQQRRAERRADRDPTGALPHPGAHPRPADLPVRRAARRRDRRRRHARRRHLRRARDRPGRLRAAHDGDQHARPSPAPGTGSATTRRTTARSTYWQAGTDVSVDIDINSVPAGNGIYGQESRSVDFQVGDAHVYKVDAQTHQMQVFCNGDAAADDPDHDRQAGLHHPLGHQGDHGEVRRASG